MGVKVINRFTQVVHSIPSTATLGDVTITLDSKYVKPSLVTLDSPYSKEIRDFKLYLTPDAMWLEGITLTVDVSGQEAKYIVPSNPYSYSPEQRLYSLGELTATGNLEKLQKLGLVTTVERGLLEALGPKLESLVLRMSKCLVTQFIYEGTTPPEDCTSLRGLRRMQQVMYMVGLDSLVETLLFSPGPERGWFRKADIVTTRRDTDVSERYQSLEREVFSLANYMQQQGLNTSMIESVDLQVPSTNIWNPVVKGIVTLFCGIRYTHDNVKFSY